MYILLLQSPIGLSARGGAASLIAPPHVSGDDARMQPWGALQSYFHKLCPDVIVHIGFGDVCLILHPCTGLMYGPVPGRGLISLIKPNTYVIVEGFGGVAAVDWG